MKRLLIAFAAVSLFSEAASAAALLDDAQLDRVDGGAASLSSAFPAPMKRPGVVFPSGGTSGLNLADSVRPIDYLILTGQISLSQFVLGLGTLW
jgi:hypothetical protein